MLIFMCLVQVLVLLLAHVPMVRDLSKLTGIRPLRIWAMYLAMLMTYATVYFTMFANARGAFNGTSNTQSVERGEEGGG